MNYRHILLPTVLLLTAMLVGCGGGIDVVDEGTYTGTVTEAVPAEREIYVTLEDGTKLELYFNEETELVRDGESVEFSALEAGTRVRLTVTRVGNRNEPQRVEIIGSPE